MWHCPISGSQVNKPAKLFKRFTPTERFEIGETDIEIENNYYRHYHSFAWVEADDMQTSDDRPLGGLIAHTDRLNIKLNGRWKAVRNGRDEPEEGDILELDGSYWIIEDGCQRTRKKSLNNFAVIYLPIKKLL